MGSCVSVHKNCRTEDSLLIESPIKEDAAHIQQLKPQSSSVANATNIRDLCTKDEIFFDSHPWLDSDGDDFFSVNGACGIRADLTPSCGNTPIHQAASIVESTPIGSSTDTKKLSELFGEGFSRNHINANQNSQGTKAVMADERPGSQITILNLSRKSVSGSQYVSVSNSICSSSEISTNISSKPEKDKVLRSVSCCLPSLARSLSFGERRKRLSAAYSVRNKGNIFSPEACFYYGCNIFVSGSISATMDGKCRSGDILESLQGCWS